MVSLTEQIKYIASHIEHYSNEIEGLQEFYEWREESYREQGLYDDYDPEKYGYAQRLENHKNDIAKLNFKLEMYLSIHDSLEKLKKSTD